MSRLIGSYPKIGIRPVIDGRRGPLKVRESLEVQTMNMAEAAANLIKNNVFYSNGEPVKTVIADTTIGRVAEAAACADKFRREFDYPTALPEIADPKQTNDSLVEVIGNSDYIEILLNTLDDYYAKTESFATPEVVESMKERYEEFSHFLEENAKAEFL